MCSLRSLPPAHVAESKHQCKGFCFQKAFSVLCFLASKLLTQHIYQNSSFLLFSSSRSWLLFSLQLSKPIGTWRADSPVFLGHSMTELQEEQSECIFPLLLQLLSALWIFIAQSPLVLHSKHLWGRWCKFHTLVHWQVFNMSRESQVKIETFSPSDMSVSSKTANCYKCLLTVQLNSRFTAVKRQEFYGFCGLRPAWRQLVMAQRG